MKISKELALLTLKEIKDRQVNSYLHLSIFSKENIKKDYKIHFPNGFGGDKLGHKPMISSHLFQPFFEKDVYFDNVDFVLLDKTLVHNAHQYTYGQLCEKLNIIL